MYQTPLKTNLLTTDLLAAQVQLLAVELHRKQVIIAT